MTVSSSAGPNETEKLLIPQLQRAQENRSRLRKNYLKERSKQASPTATRDVVHPVEILTTAKRCFEASNECLRDYLDATFKLIKIALGFITGVGIGQGEGSASRKENDAYNVDFNICRELEMLFLATVSQPTRIVRQILERRNTNISVRQQAREQVNAIVSQPLRVMFMIGDVLINGLLQAVDIDRVANGNKSQFINIRQALLRLLMYVSDCHRYQFNNGRAFDTARLMSLVSARDPEAHMRLALTGAQLTKSAVVASSTTRKNVVSLYRDQLEHFFHFCTFLANRSVPLQHKEAAVVQNFVYSCCLPEKQSIRNSEDVTATGAEEFVPLFIHAVWSCLKVRHGGESDLRRDRLWKAFAMVLDWTTNEDENKKLLLCQRECEALVASLIFASNRALLVGEMSSDFREQNAANDTRINQPEGDANLVDDMICHTILELSKACEKGLNHMLADARQCRKRRRRSIQKQNKRQREQIQQGQQKKSKNDDNLNVEILNMMNPDVQAPGLGALSLLGIYWSGLRLGSVVESQQLITEMLLSIRSLIRTIGEIFSMSGNEVFVSKVKEKLNRDQTTIAIPNQPALHEDVAVQHFKPCDGVKELQRVVKHDVALVSLVKEVARKLKAEKKGDGCNVPGELLRECLKEFGKKSFEDVAGQISRRHLEAFSLQCTKDESLKWTGMTDRVALAKVVTLVIRQSRLVNLLTHLEKVNGGTLLDRTRQLEKERKKVEKTVNESKAGDKENKCRNEVPKKRRISEVGNDQGNGTAVAFANSTTQEGQEAIADSELERRITKRRRLQNGFTVPGSTSPVPGDSHDESANDNRQKDGNIVLPSPPSLPPAEAASGSNCKGHENVSLPSPPSLPPVDELANGNDKERTNLNLPLAPPSPPPLPPTVKMPSRPPKPSRPPTPSRPPRPSQPSRLSRSSRPPPDPEQNLQTKSAHSNEGKGDKEHPETITQNVQDQPQAQAVLSQKICSQEEKSHSERGSHLHGVPEAQSQAKDVEPPPRACNAEEQTENQNVPHPRDCQRAAQMQRQAQTETHAETHAPHQQLTHFLRAATQIAQHEIPRAESNKVAEGKKATVDEPRGQKLDQPKDRPLADILMTWLRHSMPMVSPPRNARSKAFWQDVPRDPKGLTGNHMT